MKEFQVCGLGNALVDIFLDVSDADFAALGFERVILGVPSFSDAHFHGALDIITSVAEPWLTQR